MRCWSIALLDLHRESDQFQDDAALGALGAELEAGGHDVAFVRSVQASDPGGLPAWQRRLATFIRQGEFDVVVLARLWDKALLDVVRGATRPGARVIRLSHGVRAALDAHFDHVLDENGLRQLLDGVPAPAPTEFRRVEPAELRRRVARVPTRLNVLEPVGLPGLGNDDVGARPTLSGPVSGCPFLLDARKNPLFVSLGADPEGLQTKGCTFCLDNTGSFAVTSESVVLQAWLSQLRRLREADPGLREVLLVDERPHPYLPAFFRALSAEPALRPIELLFKSRVDWLLEFADSALAEAAELAAEQGSVLHLYLVGFENFEQFHLDLFNKGVTVAENLAAIAKLRELAERFPRSFEFRRYRAHGIVLFTPWTTPAALLENARVMREVNFDELRSEAIRTRLRLYPRVPLHALAEKDGLLVSSFSDGRPDRAAEQGYDASVPWRFQDPDMEAIFQAANDLGRAHGLGDSNLIELAVHHAARHRSLVTQPEVAWLPVQQALRAWGNPGSPERLCVDTTLLALDPEIELVARGLKRAALKEGVPRADADGLCRAYRAMGLVAEVAEWHGFARGGDFHEAGDAYAIVAVAADRSSLDEVLAKQPGHASRAEEARMGALMGYPPCCVRAFLDQRVRNDNLDNERLTFRRFPDALLHPLVHRVGVVRLLSHHPCSPACAGSIEIGEQILDILSSVDAPAAARAKTRLEQPVLILDYQRRLELEGAWQGDRFCVERAVVLGNARWLDAAASEITAIELSPEGVRFTLRDGRNTAVRAPRPLLTTPGQPLAPPALAAIGGPLSDEPAGLVLPAAFRKGVRVDDYRIESIARRGQTYEIVLARAGHRFDVRVRVHDPARPFTIRRGRLALDIERAEELPVAARVAIGVLVRALPAA